MTPLTVSIVTPSFNQARFLPFNLQSVARQTYPYIEHIIVDPGSVDGSREIAVAHGGAAKLIFEPDRNQSHGITKGFAAASGDLLVWLNSDDMLAAPTTIEEVVAMARHHPEADVLYGGVDFVDEHGEFLRKGFVNPNAAALLESFQYQVGIVQPGVYMRRRVFDALGGPSEAFDYCMDYEYWVRMAANGFVWRNTPTTLAHHRWWGGMKTSKGRKRSLEEHFKVCDQYFGYVHWKWIDRYAEYLVSTADGVVNHAASVDADAKQAEIARTVRRFVTPHMVSGLLRAADEERRATLDYIARHAPEVVDGAVRPAAFDGAALRARLASPPRETCVVVADRSAVREEDEPLLDLCDVWEIAGFDGETKRFTPNAVLVLDPAVAQQRSIELSASGAVKLAPAELAPLLGDPDRTLIIDPADLDRAPDAAALGGALALRAGYDEIVPLTAWSDAERGAFAHVFASPVAAALERASLARSAWPQAPAQSLPRILILDMTSCGNGTATGELKACLLERWPEDRLLQVGAHGEDLFTWRQGGPERRVSAAEAMAEIQRFKPQLVLFRPVPNVPTLHALAMQIVGRRNAPFVLWVMDDWLSALAATDPYQHRQLEADMAQLTRKAALRLAIGPTMAQELERRYRVPFGWFANGIRPEDWPEAAPQQRQGVLVRYAGGLSPNMGLQSVMRVAQAVEALAQQGADVRMEIITQRHWLDNGRRGMAGLSNVHVDVGGLAPSKYREWLRDADILLVAYNFDEASARYTQFSVANKLPEYLASGAVVLIHAPEHFATVEEARALGGAVFAHDDDPAALANLLRALIEEPSGRRAMGRRGRLGAFRQKNLYAICSRFERALIAVAAHRPEEALQFAQDRAGTISLTESPSPSSSPSAYDPGTPRMTQAKRPALVLGDGASLRDFDYARLAPFDVFGLGGGYKHWARAGWWPRYYVCLNTPLALAMRDDIAVMIAQAPALGIERFLLPGAAIQRMDGAASNERVISFDEARDHHPLLAAQPVTSVSHALGFAAALGYNDLYLFGVDAGHLRPAAFESMLPDDGSKAFALALREMAALLRQEGVRCRDLSPASSLDIFPKCAFEVAAGESSARKETPAPAPARPTPAPRERRGKRAVAVLAGAASASEIAFCADKPVIALSQSPRPHGLAVSHFVDLGHDGPDINRLAALLDAPMPRARFLLSQRAVEILNAEGDKRVDSVEALASLWPATGAFDDEPSAACMWAALLGYDEITVIGARGGRTPEANWERVRKHLERRGATLHAAALEPAA